MYITPEFCLIQVPSFADGGESNINSLQNWPNVGLTSIASSHKPSSQDIVWQPQASGGYTTLERLHVLWKQHDISFVEHWEPLKLGYQRGYHPLTCWSVPERAARPLSAPVVAATDPVKKETPRVWTCSDSKCDTEISLSIAWLIRGFLWTLEAGGVEPDWKIVVKAVLLGLWGVGCWLFPEWKKKLKDFHFWIVSYRETIFNL